MAEIVTSDAGIGLHLARTVFTLTTTKGVGMSDRI
jgi:hypothetical protein